MEDKREIIYEFEQVSNGYIIRNKTTKIDMVLEPESVTDLEPVHKMLGDMFYSEINAHMEDMETCKVKLTLTIEDAE